MDLYVDLVEAEKQHYNYINTKSDKYKVNVINGWADEPFVKRDGKDKFIKEFQTEFNSPFWELYCYQVLKQLGCSFDFQKPYPDFVSKYKGSPFLVECTIAKNASNTPAESDYNAKFSETRSSEERVHSQVIRLANSIQQKKDKLINQYHKNVDNIDKPYVIAVEPFDQPFFTDTGTEAITTLLYGWIIDHTTEREYACSSAIKENKSEVPIGIFTNAEYADVSGILYSNMATIGKVDAIGDNPNLTFEHARYNLQRTKPQVSVDSRIKDDKFDPRCKAIRKHFNDRSSLYKQYSIRKPFIMWETKYTETLTDGLYYFANPYAKFPLSKELIDEMYSSGISIISYDTENNSYIDSQLHDGSIISRFVLNLKRSYI